MDWVQTTSAELPVVESFQRQVARELHDGVAQTLTTMLIEIENFKSDQQGRPGVIQRLSVCQDTVREVLNELRGLLFELRGESAVDSTLISSLKSTYGVQFGRRSGMTVRFRVGRRWPRIIRARTARHLLVIVDEALAFGLLTRGERADVELSVAGEQAALAVRIDALVEADSPWLAARLHAIRQRVIMLGGTLDILNEAGTLNLEVGFPTRQLAGEPVQ